MAPVGSLSLAQGAWPGFRDLAQRKGGSEVGFGSRRNEAIAVDPIRFLWGRMALRGKA